MSRTVLLATSAAILLTLNAPAAFAATDCASLNGMTFPDATLTTAEAVTAGSLTLQGLEPQSSLPASCRVRVTLHPTTDSTIRFEVWLPQESWNGRLLNVGNGGFAGSISYGQMARNLRRGYATAGSDAGHQADAEDASWAYQHPEKIADFGYRAVHLTALLSKAVVRVYYDKPQEKAYFDACSDGGREALMEAQRFPEDYDGILAGAPANNWVHMLANGLALTQAISRNPAAYISSLKLPAITQAALNACDVLDGLKDGVVSDPERCRFDPAVLQCKGAEDSGCLTSPQVQALRMIYSGAKDSKGATIFPGLTPGDENPAWHDWVLGNAPAGASGTNYMSGYFRYMVLNDPTWNPLTADVDTVLQTAIDRSAKDVDAIDPDLSRFAAHGGKLIMYHGWNDPAISPLNSVQYLGDVQRAMGSAKADDTVRLYMVPGMEHCAGGPGPNIIGQLGFVGAEGEGTGAMDLLRIWVERGKAPGPILAVKVTGTREAPVRIVRPVCAYPQEAKYNGSGDPKTPESFTCKTP
jgi:Tannase and feruloyl esterase